MNNSLVINAYDNVVTIKRRDNSNTIDHVPAMVYRITVDDGTLVLIKDRQNFTLPQLRFGAHKRHFQRITASFDRDGNALGVLLIGERGSGKSLMAEEISNWALAQDLPVFIVDKPMPAQFLLMVSQAVGPCVFFFDEFEKVYNEVTDREGLLSFFSDTSLRGTLFLITVNDSEGLPDPMWLRPQRFRYAIQYRGGIASETVEDILATMKVNPAFHDAFRHYAKSAEMNFDSYMAVVRESASCKTVDDIRQLTEIMNVPNFNGLCWKVKDVVLVGVKGPFKVPFERVKGMAEKFRCVILSGVASVEITQQQQDSVLPTKRYMAAQEVSIVAPDVTENGDVTHLDIEINGLVFRVTLACVFGQAQEFSWQPGYYALDDIEGLEVETEVVENRSPGQMSHQSDVGRPYANINPTPTLFSQR